MRPFPVRRPQQTTPRICLDRGRDSRPAEASLAVQECRAGDSLSMTRPILLCQEQTSRCRQGRLPADVSCFRYYDTAIGMPDKTTSLFRLSIADFVNAMSSARDFVGFCTTATV